MCRSPLSAQSSQSLKQCHIDWVTHLQLNPCIAALPRRAISRVLQVSSAGGDQSTFRYHLLGFQRTHSGRALNNA